MTPMRGGRRVGQLNINRTVSMPQCDRTCKIEHWTPEPHKGSQHMRFATLSSWEAMDCSRWLVASSLRAKNWGEGSTNYSQPALLLFKKNFF